jgi:hypothetical protein
MLIVIPSLGRASPSKQITLRHFRRHKLPMPTLVVPESEVNRYKTYSGDDVPVVAQPASITGIAKTREWILGPFAKQQKAKYLLMLDDDMDFCWRPDITSPQLVTIDDGPRLRAMLDTLEGWLDDGFVHVGLSARQGNNNQFNNDDGVYGYHKYRDATRMMNAYAYDVKKLAALKVDAGRNPVMHDFDLTLQLLRLGLPNRVSFEYCWNQRGSNKAGGCSTYRDAALQQKSAEQLKHDHPDFVKVVLKKTKDAWKGMQERYDVNVQWRKAYDSGRSK